MGEHEGSFQNRKVGELSVSVVGCFVLKRGFLNRFCIREMKFRMTYTACFLIPC